MHMTGQRLELALSDNKVIVWPFWWFFWMHQVILTESVLLQEESSIIFGWHLDLSKKTRFSAVKAFMIRWPDE
jgi:hypothetical protein